MRYNKLSRGLPEATVTPESDPARIVALVVMSNPPRGRSPLWQLRQCFFSTGFRSSNATGGAGCWASANITKIIVFCMTGSQWLNMNSRELRSDQKRSSSIARLSGAAAAREPSLSRSLLVGLRDKATR